MLKRSNDELFNNLEVLNEYAHMCPRKALDIVKVVINAKPLRPRVTQLRGFGKLYGKTHVDLLIESLKILERISYLEMKGVIQLLDKLTSHEDKTVQAMALKSFEKLAKYNLFVLQQIGYKAQEQILAVLEAWDEERLLKKSEIVTTVSEELLTPTFEGQSMADYKTFTLHSGPLAVNPSLKDLRKKAICLLKKLYNASDSLSLRRKVLQTLQVATQTPHSHTYGDDLEQMVWEDTNDIIAIYLDILPKAENEIIQDIEEQKIWFVKRFEKKPPKEISELSEALISNAAYEMFKVFVGYDGRLEPDYDFERDRETRSKKVDEFVGTISDSNFEEWRRKILSVVKNYSVSEPGGYGYFEAFLFKLGSDKTSLAIRLAEENKKELAPFLINLLSGIWKNNVVRARQMIANWVEMGKYLPAWAFIFIVTDELNEPLLRQVIRQAKKQKDIRALNNTLRSILHHYPKNKHLISSFINVIDELRKLKSYLWIDNLWFRANPILDDLEETDWKVIFGALLLLPRVDYHAEEILKVVADKYPERIIDFFHRRVEIKSKKKRSLDDHYDGVPFNLHKLGETLKRQAGTIVPLLLNWYKDGGKESNWLFKWEASHLLEEIFPQFDPVLEHALIAQIKKGTKISREITFSILGKYKGGAHLWGVVKALVKQYADTKEYASVTEHLFGYLSQTGVVSGEDGFIRAYETKRAEIRGLKKDSDKRVRKFATEYESHLDGRITFEQKRTNEQIELMKRGLN